MSRRSCRGPAASSGSPLSGFSAIRRSIARSSSAVSHPRRWEWTLNITTISWESSMRSTTIAGISFTPSILAEVHRRSPSISLNVSPLYGLTITGSRIPWVMIDRRRDTSSSGVNAACERGLLSFATILSGETQINSLFLVMQRPPGPDSAPGPQASVDRWAAGARGRPTQRARRCCARS